MSDIQNAPKEENTLSIAMCQIFCLDSDRSGNFVRIENALKEAKEKEAEIAVFPETAILGWVNPDAHERAFSIPGADSEKLCALAKKYGVYICIGLCEKDGDDLYDTALLIDDEGNILIKHRKINTLTKLLNPPYTRGKDVMAADTKFGKIGVIICADSFHDSIRQEIKKLNPDLMLIPYGWAAPEDKWPDHGKRLHKVVTDVAKIWECPVIGVDLIGEISKGPWTGQIYGGQSVASDGKGNIIAIAKDRCRDITIVELPLR